MIRKPPIRRAGTPARLVALAALALAPGAALADVKGPPPDKVCVPTTGGQRIVDKELLARFWMSTAPINLAAIPPDVLKTLDPARLSAGVLSRGDICKDNKACSKADIESLRQIRSQTRVLLAGRMDGYVASSSVEMDAFFGTANEQDAVACPTTTIADSGQDAGAASAARKSAEPQWYERVRIRGSADQLSIAREQTGAFQASQAATLSLLRDGVARSNTYKITGAVGFVLFDTAPKTPDLGLKVVPYVGINRTAVTAFTGPSKPPSNDTVDVGLLFSDDLEGKGQHALSTYLSARPDFLWNQTDGSRLATVNLRAEPVRNALLNDYLPIPSKVFEIQTLLDFRLDAGRYTNVGSNAQAALHPDYVRMGGQAGFALDSLAKNLPLTLKVTYTGLYGVSGDVNIGYFSSALTWSLDANKYVGVSLSYVNGRREDTAKREEQTNLSLTVKY